MSDKAIIDGYEGALRSMNLELATARVEAAKWTREYAGVKLELEQVRKRAAEVASQSEPLASFIPEDNSLLRDKYIAIVRYVVYGRKSWEEKP